MIPQLLQEKINKSYDILRLASDMSKTYYQKPLVITYSGGKDSDAMLQLAVECLEPSDFEVINSHTTVDAPETVYYIRKRFKELREMGVKTTIQYPRDKDGNFVSMWSMIEKIGLPPTRIQRYCCTQLKEVSVKNRFVALGVRADESGGRKGREVFGTQGATKKDAKFFHFDKVKESFTEAEREREREGLQANEHSVWDCKIIESAKNNDKLICNPIYDWTHSDVWELIRDRGIEYNPLYDMGFHRVGCIGCPLNTKRKFDFAKYPAYAENYKKAFDRMIKRRQEKGLPCKWENGEEVFKWWIQDDTIEGQMTLDDFLEDNET